MNREEVMRIAYAHKIVIYQIRTHEYVAAFTRLGARCGYGTTAIDALTALRDKSRGADRAAVEAALAEIRRAP